MGDPRYGRQKTTEKKKYNICIADVAVGKLVQIIPHKIESRIPD